MVQRCPNQSSYNLQSPIDNDISGVEIIVGDASLRQAANDSILRYSMGLAVEISSRPYSHPYSTLQRSPSSYSCSFPNNRHDICEEPERPCWLVPRQQLLPQWHKL
jgi:hypothetical protein